MPVVASLEVNTILDEDIEEGSIGEDGVVVLEDASASQDPQSSEDESDFEEDKEALGELDDNPQNPRLQDEDDYGYEWELPEIEDEDEAQVVEISEQDKEPCEYGDDEDDAQEPMDVDDDEDDVPGPMEVDDDDELEDEYMEQGYDTL